MRIERTAACRLGDCELGGSTVAVVIDVLRASTTAAVLIERAPRIAIAGQPEAVADLPTGRWLFVSELDRVAALGDRIDNSPVDARAIELADRTPCLITTNGTRALCAAAARFDRVLMTALVNLRATQEAIAALAPDRVVIAPAGDFAKDTSHYEDDVCAELLAARLAGDAVDEAERIATIRHNERVVKRIARAPGFDKDVELALTVDSCSLAVEFVASSRDIGWLRRLPSQGGGAR